MPGRPRPPDRGVAGEQAVVQRAGVGVDDDHVGGHPLAVGQLHTRRPAALDEHLGDRGRRPQHRTAVHRPLGDGQRQPAQAAADVPGPERLLGVRHGGQGRGRPARVGARVGRVPVQQDPQPRVGEVLRAQVAQRGPRGHGADVVHRAGQPGQRAGALQRRAQERVLGDPPDLRGPVQQGRPLRPEDVAHPRQVPGDGEPAAVGEAVGDGGVEADQVQRVLQRRPGGGEQVAEDLRQRDQGGAGVEAVPVAGEPAQLPAHLGTLLEHRHRVPGGRQPGRCRQPAEPRPDHHHPCHGPTVGR